MGGIHTSCTSFVKSAAGMSVAARFVLEKCFLKKIAAGNLKRVQLKTHFCYYEVHTRSPDESKRLDPKYSPIEPERMAFCYIHKTSEVGSKESR